MDREKELEDLRRKLAAREGVGGYERNVEVIKARIAELESEPEEDNG